MEYKHEPVLLQEVLHGLNPRPGQDFIDGTVGGGGHAQAILQATSPNGRLLAFDRDQRALTAAADQLKVFGQRVIFIHDSYVYLKKYALRYGFSHVAGVLLDLGLSSDQLADTNRGFSFQTSGPLDLRFDDSTGISAAQLLNSLSQSELTQIFKNYGEEPRAQVLAKAIVERRRLKPFITTDDLLSVVTAVKGNGRRSLHPATLVWQALRLSVNQELQQLSQVLPDLLEVTVPGGRLAIISFHSGEDRIVKNFFKQEAKDCWCPPESPICQCHHRARLKLLNRQPLTAQSAEIKLNPRSRSAKLRLAEVLNSK